MRLHYSPVFFCEPFEQYKQWLAIMDCCANIYECTFNLFEQHTLFRVEEYMSYGQSVWTVIATDNSSNNLYSMHTHHQHLCQFQRLFPGPISAMNKTLLDVLNSGWWNWFELRYLEVWCCNLCKPFTWLEATITIEIQGIRDNTLHTVQPLEEQNTLCPMAERSKYCGVEVRQ